MVTIPRLAVIVCREVRRYREFHRQRQSGFLLVTCERSTSTNLALNNHYCCLTDGLIQCLSIYFYVLEQFFLFIYFCNF